MMACAVAELYEATGYRAPSLSRLSCALARINVFVEPCAQHFVTSTIVNLLRTDVLRRVSAIAAKIPAWWTASLDG